MKANTTEAVSLGIYGSPAFLVEPGKSVSESGGTATTKSGEREMLVFGSDRFEQLAYLCGKPWLGPDPARPRL